MNLKPIPLSFYHTSDVQGVARDLLGKILITCFEDRTTAVRIVETEAYNGEVDRASHAFGRRYTPRTKVMYEAGGLAYVYLCYGLHQMFNVVAGEENNPLAILVRAGEPLEGSSTMLERRKMKLITPALTNGPGKLASALALHTRHSGMPLNSENLFIADDGYRLKKDELGISPRIGVDYAGDDALLPYRYFIRGNSFVGKF